MVAAMVVLEGCSTDESGAAAVAEATHGWEVPPAGLDLVLAFASTRQDPHEVAAALAARLGDAPVVGCTTAGEHQGAAHMNGSLVVTGISTPGVRWATAVADVRTFDEASAGAVRDALLAQLGIEREDLDPQKHFCLVFIDGLSCKEETVSSLMADALEGVPLLGGSAGDDLRFDATYVLHGGAAHRSGAVFAFAESDAPFRVIKHQHYTTTPASLVITRADVPTRRVHEMDGYPALEAYARALGMDAAAVTPDVTFMNPLTFVCNGEIYVRSIQRVEPDGSIIFYCAVEEGMVLSVGGHADMVSSLAEESEKAPEAELFIAFNCILRALEASKRALEAPLGRSLQRFGRHVVGFDTYGEQLAGLHINQTLVGIALQGAAR